MNSNMIDLTQAVVVIPATQSGREQKATSMLVEEVGKRTGVFWKISTEWPTTAVPVIGIGQASALQTFATSCTDRLIAGDDISAAEGYHIRVLDEDGRPSVFLIGNDARGVLYAVGYLLRNLRMQAGRVTIPAGTSVTSAPYYRLRGHQLGYRDKTNSYCGWDLGQWEQYIRDLVVFGANAIELIPPRSDDNLDSVHFPLPPLDMMVGMSQLADDYGIDAWIWFPAMDTDYTNPATSEAALDEWGQVFKALPHIDAVFVPGGDPGKTRPRHLMPLLEKQTQNLRRFHPHAQMWVSPQGFTKEWMGEFVGILDRESPDWLTGVVFGPWIHMSTAEFRNRIPRRYAIRNYPDITHSLSCQHPVANWDVAYALTEGREPINPRPLAMAAIFHHEQPHTMGFLTYSEGCNDDVNKCIWSALGWDPQKKVIDVLREYSRYFIGDRYADDFAQGLLALEQNWQGPLICNTGVHTTLQQFQAMEAAASPRDLKNWRFLQGLYRAYYDAYVRSRLLYETSLEEQALDQLRQAPRKGSLVALAEAERLLDLAVHQPIATGWRTRIFQLAEALFQSIHMQLSVGLYRGQEEVRGANLDGIDYPLNNGPWLKERFAELRALASEPERLDGIKAILDWTNPGPGGFYDDFGNSSQQVRLAQEPEIEPDPTFLRSPLRSYPYRKDPRTLRLAWRRYTGALNDAPFAVHYAHLDPTARYKVRVVYSAENPHIPVRLEANEGIEVHPFILKPVTREPVEFEIPPEATREGELKLRWYREPGHGGAGRGCEVSEVWLIKI